MLQTILFQNFTVFEVIHHTTFPAVLTFKANQADADVNQFTKHGPTIECKFANFYKQETILTQDFR